MSYDRKLNPHFETAYEHEAPASFNSREEHAKIQHGLCLLCVVSAGMGTERDDAAKGLDAVCSASFRQKPGHQA